MGARSARPDRASKGQRTWMSSALEFSHFLPGLIVGFLVGLWVELPRGNVNSKLSSAPTVKRRSRGSSIGRGSNSVGAPPIEGGGELKMVFVVRQDLKMGAGKIASQCAHAAVGIYEELLSGQRPLLNRWEECGQPKIVVTCKNQQEMNELRGKAEKVGLPTFTVADAGRTQVAAGSKTVLVIGPGTKASVDSITRNLRLL